MFFFVALAHITTSPAPRWQTGSLGIPTPRVSLPGTSDAVHSVPCEGPNASRTETGHACETFAWVLVEHHNRNRISRLPSISLPGPSPPTSCRVTARSAAPSTALGSTSSTSAQAANVFDHRIAKGEGIPRGFKSTTPQPRQPPQAQRPRRQQAWHPRPAPQVPPPLPPTTPPPLSRAT